MPANKCGTVQIDPEYLSAVEDSVPRRGKAWTYSHFPGRGFADTETRENRN